MGLTGFEPVQLKATDCDWRSVWYSDTSNQFPTIDFIQFTLLLQSAPTLQLRRNPKFYVTPLGLEPRTLTLRTDSKTRTCDISTRLNWDSNSNLLASSRIYLTISVISVIDFKVNRELCKCYALPTELICQFLRKCRVPTPIHRSERSD